MSARLRVALGNIMVGFGTGYAFPGRLDHRLLLAVDLVGLALIMGAVHRLREVPAERES